MTRISPRGRLFVGLAALGSGLLCLVVIVIPAAETAGSAVAPWFRLALKPACHQIGERCLDFGNGPLAVCARCFGLYTGGFLGLLATFLSGHRVCPKWKVIGIAAAPSIIDFSLGQLGLSSLTNWPRFAAALLPGLLLGLLLGDAISTITFGKSKSRGGPIT